MVIINEEEIIQQRSPLSDGSYVADTANTSTFKLLLTGVDDSALTPGRGQTAEEQSRAAQLDLLTELIADYRVKVREIAGPPAELEEQVGKLEGTMLAQGEHLAVSEEAYRNLAGRRQALLKRIEEGGNRLTEITTLLDRFSLLDDHYRSDIERLEGIVEAGSLFAALGDATCPLCGAAPEYHRTSDCNGDVGNTITAAHAEIGKIQLLQAELTETVTALQKEAAGFKRRLPHLEQSLDGLSQEIERIVAPKLRRMRSSYRELADKRGEVREALGLYTTLKDLEDRKTNLEAEGTAVGANIADVDLPASVADKFATTVLDILKHWHFPDADRVHFDMKARDLVINGKNRTSYGKGLRAITQAAFTVGLLEYCRREGTPHPGFVVLDSPLLSYREPDNEFDDLRGTDLLSHFFGFLAELKEDRQVIVIENTDPPPSVRATPQTLHFTGVPAVGRAGLFPK